LLLLFVIGLSPSLTVGCGGGGLNAKIASVKKGPMPDGGSWTGVYYSPLYGWLHLVEEGDLVTGRWIRPRRDRWGELSGESDGNVLKFDWKEYEYGLVGPNSNKSGKGYFVYSRPEGDNVDDRIAGEIGKGDDEVGAPWDGVKQRNQKPDLQSIGGASPSDIGGGDWDSSNQESGSPEAPTPPPDEGPSDEGSSDGPSKAPELP
jgi:hypothetical protein